MAELPALTEFHHGDCVGADDEAADAVHSLSDEELSGVRIVCHPPADETHRAFNDKHCERREPKTHFARNRAIVEGTDALVACPCEMQHQSRGGTWYTHDYAKKHGKPVYVVWPDGTVSGHEKRPDPNGGVDPEDDGLFGDHYLEYR